MATDKKGRKLPKGIRQRGTGYEGRFNYKYKEYVVHGRTITETQKAIVDLKYQLEHGTYIPKSKLTLDEWFDTWMEEYKKNNVKRGTLITYRDIYKNMIQEDLGAAKLSDIRPEHVQRLYNHLRSEEYSASSLSLAAMILDGCLKQAYKNGIIETNPASKVQAPSRKKGKRNSHIALTKDQQALFMEYAKDSYLYNFFAVMLRTGMRCGEMRGLKYTDIDKEKM